MEMWKLSSLANSMNQVFSLGLFLIVLGFGIAAHTSNLVLNREEKELAKAYRAAKRLGDRTGEHSKHAYFNWWIAILCRLLMLTGAIICFISII